MDNVNRGIVKAWLWWALIWLTITPLFGVILAIKFHHPEFLGGIEWLSFGRLRPAHVNGVIFGAFSTPFIALTYYLVPRLCGVRLYKESWCKLILWLWNLFLISGTVSLLLGYNLGFEAGEYQWPLNILRFIAVGLITIQVIGTVLRRKEPRFYVSLWYICAAFVWTVLNLLLGNIVLPYTEIYGVNSAAMHGLFIHYIVGLWLTPAGLAIIYYFLPLSTKNPLFSHRISLLGFWSLAIFYPFVGTHHYLLSPIPHFTQTISIVTSMLLIIPVWAVTVNFFGTAKGKWSDFISGRDADHFAAKFLLLGAFFYLLGCFQGSVEALRNMQELTHFNDFVISHSHFTVFGAMVLWAVGGTYYVWPRVTGRKLWSSRLASWHLWLTIAGSNVMFFGLAAQGFIQGSLLELGANFVDTIVVMKPWWIGRTVAGSLMDIGLLLMLLNCYYSFRKGEAIEKTSYSEKHPQDQPLNATIHISWFEKPSGVMVMAGLVLFFLAVFLQGGVPLLSDSTKVKTVSDVSVFQTVKINDYNNEEMNGRKVYIRDGCWYCHSQYIRKMDSEKFLWGPVSQVGEYAFDRPQLLGTRRIGPDLTRIGLKYGNDWHAAHFWNPRSIVPDSIMPRFTWLFESPDGQQRPELNADGKSLVAYLQKLGTSIGDWRENFAPTRLISGAGSQESGLAVSQKTSVDTGLIVYQRRCIGCHGEQGDGKGPAAIFLNPKPRDFTRGIFKFRSTSGMNSLPTNGDLYLTITHGLWGTAMPPWYDISERERHAVIEYIKKFSARWTEESFQEISVPTETALTQASIENGKAIFEQQCAYCHGNSGQGDGVMSNDLTDFWGEKLKPANFTLPAGYSGGVKLGHNHRHLYLTIVTGVGGTPMPVFEDILTANEIWDVVHYVQSLRVKAHINELVAAKMPNDKIPTALEHIWSSVSLSARRGKMEQSLINLSAKRLNSSRQDKFRITQLTEEFNND